MNERYAILFRKERSIDQLTQLIPIKLIKGEEYWNCFCDDQDQDYVRYDSLTPETLCYGFPVTNQDLKEAFPTCSQEERKKSYMNLTKGKVFYQTKAKYGLAQNTWMRVFPGKEMLLNQTTSKESNEYYRNLLFFNPVSWKESEQKGIALTKTLNQGIIEAVQNQNKIDFMLELEEDLQKNYPLEPRKLYQLIETYQKSHPKFLFDELAHLFSLSDHELSEYRSILQYQKALAKQLSENQEGMTSYRSVLASYYQMTLGSDDIAISDLVKREYYDTIIGVLLEQQDPVAISMLQKMVQTIPEYHFLPSQTTFEPFNSYLYFKEPKEDLYQLLENEIPLELCLFLYQRKKKEQLTTQTMHLLYQCYDSMKLVYYPGRLEALLKQREGLSSLEETRYFEVVLGMNEDGFLKNQLLQTSTWKEEVQTKKQYTYAKRERTILPVPKLF